MPERLKTYLRTLRKRSGLSQAEVAFLLDESSRKRVSSYERAFTEPSLQAAIACEIVFDEATAEVFAGVYEEVELAVIMRAHRLMTQIEAREPSPSTAQKLESLRRIVKRRRSANAK